MSNWYKDILNQGARKNTAAKPDRNRAFEKEFVREKIV
jgi:hypothetical protein